MLYLWQQISGRFFFGCFLWVCFLGVAPLLPACGQATAGDAMVMTGKADPGLVGLDRVMQSFMQARGVPGGALAVVKDGNLIYARGYGWADEKRSVPVQPGSLFRIASLSKMITSAAIMTLVQRGKLSLDSPAFPLLHLTPYLEPGTHPDLRVNQITVRQLLHHTGGFDSAKSFDPMFRVDQIAHTLSVPAPAAPTDIVRYMMGRPLDFTPGTRFAYSNFGYCVLGRLIERVSGMTYGAYVQKYVLSPLGITDMRLGHTALRGAYPSEVHYWQPNDGNVPSVYPDQGIVPYCYGGFDMEALDSHGGWIASAVDLARFATRVDSLFTSKVDAALYARPAPPLWRNPDGSLAAVYYACGWLVRPVGTQAESNKWHDGSLPGTFGLVIRRADGVTWVALFNERSEGTIPSDEDLDPLMNQAVDAVRAWPERNLFAK